MSVQKEDYRTNRADYALAATGQSAVVVGRNEERGSQTLRRRDSRISRLAANPCESLPGPTARPRGE